MTRDELIALLPLGEPVEISAGVIIERRCFMTTLALALSAAVIPGVVTAKLARLGNEQLTFEEFLKEVIPVARKLVGDTSIAGQDQYLQTLATYAIRLVDVPVPEMRDSGQGAGPGTFLGFNPGGDPFTVLHWRMEPGSVIRTHAHTYGNVVTLGLAGQIKIVNFEMVGVRDFAAKGTFKVRQTQAQLLSPGDVNLVNLECNYIHGFQAGSKGGRGLDITTRIREKKPTPYLNLAKKADGAKQKIYEASWTD